MDNMAAGWDRPQKRTVSGRLLASYVLVLVAFAVTVGWSFLALREAARDAELLRAGYAPVLLRIGEALRSHVFGKDHGAPPVGGIVEALTRRRPQNAMQAIDAPMARAVGRALEQAGIKPANRVRKIGDYILERILFEHPSGLYQDWLARHAALAETHRMVRLYPCLLYTSPSPRD